MCLREGAAYLSWARQDTESHRRKMEGLVEERKGCDDWGRPPKRGQMELQLDKRFDYFVGGFELLCRPK